VGDAQIVVIGDALIDEIRDADGAREFVGGAALNVAVGLAVLGNPTSLIAMVGADDSGAAIRRHLARYGVGLIATPGPLGSSRAVSERIDGEPRYTFNEAAQRRRVVIDDAAREALDAATHVVISCFPFDDTAQLTAVLGAVRDRARRLIVDPNPRTGMMRDLAEFRRGVAATADACRLMKIGGDDAALLYGTPVEDCAATLLASGVGAVLTTAGTAGAALHAAGRRAVGAPVAVLPGAVVDTMGAGDATLAAVVSRIVAADRVGEPVDWPAALTFAMRVAAATCRVQGALLRLPPTSVDEEPSEN
jgi:fructokinase